MGIAMRSGFQGGLVVDYPNSKKAKKFFLCLMTGGSTSGGAKERVEVPKGLTGEPEEDREDARVKFERARAREGRGEKGKKRKHPKEAAKDWVLRKKEVRIAPVDLYYCTFPVRSLILALNLVVSATRKGGRSSRFKIHCKEAKGCLLVGHSILLATIPLSAVMLYPCSGLIASYLLSPL